MYQWCCFSGCSNVTAFVGIFIVLVNHRALQQRLCLWGRAGKWLRKKTRLIEQDRIVAIIIPIFCHAYLPFYHIFLLWTFFRMVRDFAQKFPRRNDVHSTVDFTHTCCPKGKHPRLLIRNDKCVFPTANLDESIVRVILTDIGHLGVLGRIYLHFKSLRPWQTPLKLNNLGQLEESVGTWLR